jgi:hypothetical protein
MLATFERVPSTIRDEGLEADCPRTGKYCNDMFMTGWGYSCHTMSKGPLLAEDTQDIPHVEHM